MENIKVEIHEVFRNSKMNSFDEKRDSHELEALMRKLNSELNILNEELTWHYSLEELEEKDVSIPTKNGNLYVVTGRDIAKLKKALPKHLHKFLKLPIEIELYLKLNETTYIINGDSWQKRMVKYLLGGKLEYNAQDKISFADVERLVMLYPSAVRLKITLGVENEESQH